MSKSARKHRPVKKSHKPHHEPKPASRFNIKSPIIAIIITAIMASIPFSMGKYFEFNTPDPFDSGCYVYSAQHILNGARIGVDEKPSAQIGTLLVNILGVKLFGFNEIGPKLIQMILQATAFVLMFITMRRLFGTLAASVGVIIASIYLSAPLIAKYGNVKEQHMIAFMIMGMSCFVLYQLNGKWWCAIPAGAFLSVAPLFKETGTSALGAVGLFLILQPLLKHNSWKQTGTDILLLVAGAIAMLAPISLWLAVGRTPIHYYPYSFLYRSFFAKSHAPQISGQNEQPAKADVEVSAAEKPAVKQGLIMKILPAYVSDSWQALDANRRKQARLKVFRYYRLLILPIALAVGAIILRIIRIILGKRTKPQTGHKTIYDRFVLLFAVWWLLDMSFVWISPRSYVQYYLPLNASAAMLGGYLITVYYEKAKNVATRPKWIAVGSLGLLLMVIMSWHIFFGIRTSSDVKSDKEKGYLQAMRSASAKSTSEAAGEYIKNNSSPGDQIYVWGWVPGIYVSAQRLSPAPKAFEGTMHTLSPEALSERIDEILNSFKDKPPKFIVDSRKVHFPWNRPPLELWPIVRYQGMDKEVFLPLDPKMIEKYDKDWSEMLSSGSGGVDEAERYKAMAPFRKYIRDNYDIAEQRQYGYTRDGQLQHLRFGDYVVFKLKKK